MKLVKLNKFIINSIELFEYISYLCEKNKALKKYLNLTINYVDVKYF